MKKMYLIILVFILIGLNSVLSKAKSENSENKIEDILQGATKTALEYKLEKSEKVEIGEIKFKVKKANLWIKEKNTDKKKLNEFAEITLPGKLYNPSKRILTIEKKEVNRNTIEGAVASVFSANKSGDLDWIVDNFIDKDKEKIKSIFKDKKILDQSQKDTEKIISTYIYGQADYKGSVLVFIEQDYIERGKIKESLALKKTEKGWKVTNEFVDDKTFDVVFAAVSAGEVSLKGKESPKENSVKDSKS